MSTYQFFIILHGLKDVLVWLVPLLVGVLFAVTALVISTRWLKQRRSAAVDLARIDERLDEIESRLTSVERSVSAGDGGAS